MAPNMQIFQKMKICIEHICVCKNHGCAYLSREDMDKLMFQFGILCIFSLRAVILDCLHSVAHTMAQDMDPNTHNYNLRQDFDGTLYRFVGYI